MPEEDTQGVDSVDVLQSKVKRLVELMKQSQYMVVLTGAGIVANLPRVHLGHINIPTTTHMALVQLVNQGIVKHIVSQTNDGLHMRSGIDRSKLSELLGNEYVEKCKVCHKEYIRNFVTRNPYNEVNDHKTTRTCDQCGSALYDTMVSTGESLSREQFFHAIDVCSKCDLALVLGMNLRVSPANDLPVMCLKNHGHMVIVDVNTTPLDRLSDPRIFASYDDVMTRVMRELSLTIPAYVFQTKLEIGIEQVNHDEYRFFVRPAEKGNILAEEINEAIVKMIVNDSSVTTSILKYNNWCTPIARQVTQVTIEFDFRLPTRPLRQGASDEHHHQQHTNVIQLTISPIFTGSQIHRLQYNVISGKWKHCIMQSDA